MADTRPRIAKLGTIDICLMETTPVVFHGRLVRYEFLRAEYRENKTGAVCSRFVDVATGRRFPTFAPGCDLGSAYVEGDVAYVYAVPRAGSDEILVFRSTDLTAWTSQRALKTDGWGIYNTSVCRGDGRYVMAFEVGEPPEVVGQRFTMRFAESDDLLNWRILPEDCVFAKDRYTACPALRYLGGHYYMIYLEAYPDWHFASHIVRSADLIRWESSPYNPMMVYSEEDRVVANENLSAEERKQIAEAADIDCSDIDLCEFEGKVIIMYAWGDQRTFTGLAQAEYDGTLAEFLRGWFSGA